MRRLFRRGGVTVITATLHHVRIYTWQRTSPRCDYCNVYLHTYIYIHRQARACSKKTTCRRKLGATRPYACALRPAPYLPKKALGKGTRELRGFGMSLGKAVDIRQGGGTYMIGSQTKGIRRERRRRDGWTREEKEEFTGGKGRKGEGRDLATSLLWGTEGAYAATMYYCCCSYYYYYCCRCCCCCCCCSTEEGETA